MIELPKEILPPSKEVPSTLILFGLPKCGKTTELSKLPNCLNIDIERGGDFVSSLRIQPPPELGPVGIFNWLKEVTDSIKKEENPYDFVAIETISYLDELSEWIGTYRYCNSIQGKKFNRDSTGKLLAPSDPDYNSVHTLPDGNGYRYSREVMTDIFNMCKGLGRICTIFTCHVADKFIASKLTNKDVRAIDLSLTGKVRNIYARDVDAIGYIYNKEGIAHISFKGDEEKLGGMRGSQHIQGYDGPVDWNLIFKLKK